MSAARLITPQEAGPESCLSHRCRRTMDRWTHGYALQVLHRKEVPLLFPDPAGTQAPTVGEGRGAGFFCVPHSGHRVGFCLLSLRCASLCEPTCSNAPCGYTSGISLPGKKGLLLTAFVRCATFVNSSRENNSPDLNLNLTLTDSRISHLI